MQCNMVDPDLTKAKNGGINNQLGIVPQTDIVVGSLVWNKIRRTWKSLVLLN
jgi:hypothetical protein